MTTPLRFKQNRTVHSTAQHSTVQHITSHHSSLLYSTAVPQIDSKTRTKEQAKTSRLAPLQYSEHVMVHSISESEQVIPDPTQPPPPPFPSLPSPPLPFPDPRSLLLTLGSVTTASTSWNLGSSSS